MNTLSWKLLNIVCDYQQAYFLSYLGSNTFFPWFPLISTIKLFKIFILLISHFSSYHYFLFWLLLKVNYPNAYLFHFCNRIPDRNQLKEGNICFGLKFQGMWSIIANRSWWQKLKKTGHSVSTLGKHWVINTDTQISFSFLCNLGPHYMELCHPH